MVTTITGFLRIFNEAGLSTATIQKRDITHVQVSNLFWTNVGLGGTISALLALSAPAIAWFYREPRLVGVTLALCVTFLLTSSAVQHLAILKRQMRFKTVALIQVMSMGSGILVGISMAAFKYGYWSLVGMQLTTPLVSFLLTWLMSSWRPQLPARCSETPSLLAFGANLTATSFLWSLARGSDSLLIGRFYGSGPLGLYSRAAALLHRPVEQFMSPIESVIVPTLSRLQSQPVRYRRATSQLYDAIAVATFPFSGLFLALAHPLTLVVLGPKWESAAPILAGFSLIALYTPVASVGSWMLVSQGRGRDFLIVSSIGSSLMIVSFLIGLPFGPVGVAVSFTAFCLSIELPLLYYIAGRRGPVTTKDLWTWFARHLPIWGSVFLAASVTHYAVRDVAPLIQLLICVPVALLGGLVAICIFTPSRNAVRNLWRFVEELWRSRRIPSNPR
jgi:O-antigen/teichoic acid export membrane protein